MLNFFPCILWLLLHAGRQWLTDSASASDKVAGQQCAFWHGALLKEVFNYFSQLNSANLNLHFSFAPLFSATFSSKFFVHCSALSKKFSNLRISVGEHHHHHRRHHHHCRRRRRRHQLSFHVAWQHDLALSLSLAEKSNAVFLYLVQLTKYKHWYTFLFCFVLLCLFYLFKWSICIAASELCSEAFFLFLAKMVSAVVCIFVRLLTVPVHCLPHFPLSSVFHYAGYI